MKKIHRLTIDSPQFNSHSGLENALKRNVTSYPVGIWCQNDIVLTSMRRDHVGSTLTRRHFTSCARWVSFDSRNGPSLQRNQ